MKHSTFFPLRISCATRYRLADKMVVECGGPLLSPVQKKNDAAFISSPLRRYLCQTLIIILNATAKMPPTLLLFLTLGLRRRLAPPLLPKIKPKQFHRLILTAYIQGLPPDRFVIFSNTSSFEDLMQLLYEVPLRGVGNVKSSRGRRKAKRESQVILV